MANLTCPSVDLNFLSPNGFMLTIERMPKVSFFAQTVTLPDISIPGLAIETPFTSLEIPSDRPLFGDFNITFAIDEKMSNWLEVFQWIQGLGFPKEYQQYITENNKAKIPSIDELSKNYSDAKLMILGSNNQVVKTFNFVDCFPSSLGGITFGTTNTDVQYATASLTLEYTLYYPS